MLSLLFEAPTVLESRVRVHASLTIQKENALAMPRRSLNSLVFQHLKWLTHLEQMRDAPSIRFVL